MALFFRFLEVHISNLCYLLEFVLFLIKGEDIDLNFFSKTSNLISGTLFSFWLSTTFLKDSTFFDPWISILDSNCLEKFNFLFVSFFLKFLDLSRMIEFGFWGCKFAFLISFFFDICTSTSFFTSFSNLSNCDSTIYEDES